MNSPAEVFAQLQVLFLWMIPLTLLALAAQVFLGLCIYNDARSKGDNNAVLWGVLSAISTLAAVIYLIVRAVSKPRPIRCGRCGNWVPPGYPYCPVCAQPIMNAVVLPSEQEHALFVKKRTRYLILFIVLYAVAFLATVLVTVFVMMDVFSGALSGLTSYPPTFYN